MKSRFRIKPKVFVQVLGELLKSCDADSVFVPSVDCPLCLCWFHSVTSRDMIRGGSQLCNCHNDAPFRIILKICVVQQNISADQIVSVSNTAHFKSWPQRWATD